MKKIVSISLILFLGLNAILKSQTNHLDGQTKLINPIGRTLLLEKDNGDSWLTFNDPADSWFSFGIDYSDGGKLKLNYGGTPGDNNHFLMTKEGKIAIGGNVISNSQLTITGPSTSYPNNKALYINTEGESSIYRDQILITSNVNTGYGIAFAGQGHHRAGLFAENTGGTSITGQLTLWARNSGNIILDGGKVGLGTINPTSKLDIFQSSEGSNVNLLTLGNQFQTLNTEVTLRFAPTSAPDIRYAAISGLEEGNNCVALRFITGAGSAITEKMRITSSGNVGIGTTTPTHKLAVNGTIRSKEIIVDTDWSDFVFSPTYTLISLEDLEQYIKTNKHLPDVPSEKEVKENGLSLGQSDAVLLQKIEELTLYLIEQNKEVKSEKLKVESLQNENLKLKNEISELKKLNIKLLELEKEIEKLKFNN